MIAVCVAAGVVLVTGLVWYLRQNKPKSTFLNKESKEKKKVQLVERTQISHDTVQFRFALESPDQVLGLPCGNHFKLYCPNPKGSVEGQWNGKEDHEASAEEVIPCIKEVYLWDCVCSSNAHRRISWRLHIICCNRKMKPLDCALQFVFDPVSLCLCICVSVFVCACVCARVWAESGMPHWICKSLRACIAEGAWSTWRFACPPCLTHCVWPEEKFSAQCPLALCDLRVGAARVVLAMCVCVYAHACLSLYPPRKLPRLPRACTSTWVWGCNQGCK